MSEETDYSFDCSVDNPGERIAFIQAELAVREKEALEAIKGDICDWLSRTLDLTINEESFLDTLDTGVAVCKLATLIQQAAKEIETKERPLKVKVPMKPLSCNAKAGRGTFFARDNTSNFISWCRDLGVDEALVFESNGLVDHSDEKRVVLCLLDVARFADRVGISPPELVRMEREIEELEAQELENTTQPTSNDDKLQELSLLSPQQEQPSTVKIPPTDIAAQLPTTENIIKIENTVETPPTEITVPLPPTENTVKKPPTDITVPLPPTENTVTIPPTENTVQIPPTENAVPLPPTEIAVLLPPTEITVPLPPTDITVKLSTENAVKLLPTEINLSSKKNPSKSPETTCTVSSTTQGKSTPTTFATGHPHPIRARSQSPVRPTKSPLTRTSSTKIPSPVHSSARPRQIKPTPSITTPSPPVRAHRAKRLREEEDTQHKNKRQRGETEERKNESVDEKVSCR